LPSLFGTRRRLPTSATATSTCGQLNPDSWILAGTETSISFLFFDAPRLSLAEAVARGEPRYVRSRKPRCRFLLLAQVCPTAIPPRTPHLRGLRLRSIVRINVHGSKDRAKDASPKHMHDHSCLRRVHALVVACRRRSPPRRPPDIRCHRRVRVQWRKPPLAYGPTEILVPTELREERRLPEDQDAFHRHGHGGMMLAKGLLPPASAPALPLTPPTLFPQVGESAFDGHCKATVRSPAGPWQLRECRHLFDLRGIPRLGLTTQARPRARPTRPSARTDCLARTDVGRSA
jgi:hypothetical protein